MKISHFWQEQWYLLLAAIIFFTRIPVKTQVPDQALQLNRAARFLPVIGLIVGGLSAVAFVGFYALWQSSWLALLLSTVVGVLLTGAFHEDGFADSCDGFGGGWQKDQVLSIMKDSRLGTYGAVGLGLMMAIKLSALFLLSVEIIPWALLLGHSLSRSFSASFMYTLNYVRDEVDRKFSGHSERITKGELAFIAATGLSGMLFLSLGTGIAILLVLFALHRLLTWYWLKRIGGYTGDCLGGAQQLAEVFIYLVLCAVPLSLS
ncbi:adenosylcobinamide-GDP ribazoletransferase [Oceanospirillum maris]|uniref:adenosylcobinamide-GDP ribazoletransferase n=1 Tax=Oceanospirillum maris TaxID=64977 RepID=UPI0004172D12|nr:adenosylcobinamide-GDP ribazoletransferase [Oceanospirillum maris]